MTPKRLDLKLTEAQTVDEAMNHIFIGLKWFLKNHFKKTTIVILLLAGSSLYVVYDYVTTTKAKILEAKPIGAEIENFSLIDIALAEETGLDSIIIDGKFYGFSDPEFGVWKMLRLPVVLVHDRTTGQVWKVEVSGFTKEKLRSTKK